MRHLNDLPIWHDAHRPPRDGVFTPSQCLILQLAEINIDGSAAKTIRTGHVVPSGSYGAVNRLAWVGFVNDRRTLMTRMQWVVALLMVLSVTTVPAWADVVCANQNTAVPATTPTADFVLHGDGTVTHTRTGLMWMRCSLGQDLTNSGCSGDARTFSWRNALNEAYYFNTIGGFAGHTDWRLPNKNELESIVEERCWNPAINAAVFPNTRSSPYWSSSPLALDSIYAWYVGFYDGHVYWQKHAWGGRVRLVRAGQ